MGNAPYSPLFLPAGPYPHLRVLGAWRSPGYANTAPGSALLNKPQRHRAPMLDRVLVSCWTGIDSDVWLLRRGGRIEAAHEASPPGRPPPPASCQGAAAGGLRLPRAARSGSAATSAIHGRQGPDHKNRDVTKALFPNRRATAVSALWPQASVAEDAAPTAFRTRSMWRHTDHEWQAGKRLWERLGKDTHPG